MGLILTRIAIGILMLAVASLILGIGVRLLKDNTKRNEEKK